MTVPLRSDGWPVPEHVDCYNEIEYLWARVHMAETVVYAVRDFISPFGESDEKSLVYAVGSYTAFLGNRPDPSKSA